MKIERKNLEIIARTLTHVFSPSVMFIFLSLILYLEHIPNSLINFFIWFGSTAVFIVIGILLIIFLRKTKKISDYNITKREERPAFFFPLLTIMLALTLLNYIWGWREIANYMSLMTFTYAVAFTITLYFKISIHMLSVTLAYLVAGLSFGGIWLLALLPIPLVTGWTRIYLKKHTKKEVLAGFVLPIVITILWLIVTVDVTSL